MEGNIYINGKNAYEEWGILLDTGSLSSLMTPAPLKNHIENKCRLRHGTTVIIKNPRTDERDITLTLQLVARSEDDFFDKYGRFCMELQKGKLRIRTDYQPDVEYHCIYRSCSQFSQFMRGLAKFSLKINEPDPSDRQRRIFIS